MIDAVVRGDIDIAMAWGPLAGYYARTQPLSVIAGYSGDVYGGAVHVRNRGRGTKRRYGAQDAPRSARWRGSAQAIQAILDEFGVPRTGEGGAAMRKFAAVAFCAVALISCRREERESRPAPAQLVVFRNAATESDITPGRGSASQHLHKTRTTAKLTRSPRGRACSTGTTARAVIRRAAAASGPRSSRAPGFTAASRRISSTPS